MRTMAWCMISTLIGAIIFASGMAFERLLSTELPEVEKETEDKIPAKEDMSFFGQWKNLLDYDGTRQEESDYENR